MFDKKYIIAADGIRFQEDAHPHDFFFRTVEHIHLIQHLFPAFCPADGFFPVKGAELLDNRFLMGDFLLLIHPGFALDVS